MTDLPYKEVHDAEDAEDVHEHGSGNVARVLLQVIIKHSQTHLNFILINTDYGQRIYKGCVNHGVVRHGFTQPFERFRNLCLP